MFSFVKKRVSFVILLSFMLTACFQTPPSPSGDNVDSQSSSALVASTQPI
jgi:starvation-inducible outer membrane lipoprotein